MEGSSFHRFNYSFNTQEYMKDNLQSNAERVDSSTRSQDDTYINLLQQQALQMPNIESFREIQGHVEKPRPTKQPADSPGDPPPVEKLHRCEYCAAMFLQKHHLKQHMNTHTGDRPFRCDKCTASFAQKHSLKRHKQTHTGEKPFQCDHCSAVFSLRHGLTQHLIIHSGEKPYKCGLCSSKFSRKFSLDRHQKVHEKAAISMPK